jgi:ParB family chromosome partitioning protein
MATIATLKATEDTSPSSVLSTASIPLNKLTVWEGNVRKTDARKGLDELIASIAAHGILHSLVVKKASRGKYSIIAGRRRHLALSALAEAGTIASDAPVPCRIVSGSADSAEISPHFAAAQS